MKKEERNCGMPYPIYPPYQGPNMMPCPGPMYPNAIPFTSNPNNEYNNIENRLNNIEEQINLLDKRITTLENNNISTNNYSSTNYQMM